MNIHQNARLTPLGRARLVALIENGVSFVQAALSCGVSAKTAAKWYRRFRCEGRAGLQDRSSRPARLHQPTPQAICDRIIALRRQRLTGTHIAHRTGVSPATVSRVLRRAGLARLRDLEPAQPVHRYERERPGEMIHLDIKRLGRFTRKGHRITGNRAGQSNTRGVGWEYVHVCIDDHSRLSFTQIHPDEKAVSAITHLRAAAAWFASMGVRVERGMTPSHGLLLNPLPDSG